MTNHAVVTWKEGMHFEGTSRGQTVHIDAPIPTGQGLGMSPMDMVLVAMGGCTGMDVVHILQKEKKEVTGVTMEISGEKATELPTVYTDIQITYTVRGHGLTHEAVERAVKLSEEKYCCVGVMLGKSAKITSHIKIEEG